MVPKIITENEQSCIKTMHGRPKVMSQETGTYYFGSESIEETKKGAKKPKLTEESRTKRIEELTEDITSLSDSMRLFQKQRARDERALEAVF